MYVRAPHLRNDVVLREPVSASRNQFAARADFLAEALRDSLKTGEIKRQENLKRLRAMSRDDELVVGDEVIMLRDQQNQTSLDPKYDYFFVVTENCGKGLYKCISPAGKLFLYAKTLPTDEEVLTILKRIVFI